MFGYVRTLNDELKIKDSKLYQSIYCGLCANMKKHYRFFNLTLSYDFVFLALIRLGISEEEVKIIKKRCPYNPFRKKYIIDNSSDLDTVSYCSAVLMYYKALDDCKDEKCFKKLKSSLLKKIAKRTIGKFNREEVFEKLVEESLSKINQFENNEDANFYDPAEEFGKILGIVFSLKVNNNSTERILYELGWHIGRWIYIADAYNDLSEDLKSGNYNPFIISGNYKDPEFSKNLEQAMMIELSEAEKALFLLDIKNESINDIIYNIMHLGMPDVIASVSKKYQEKEDDND